MDATLCRREEVASHGFHYVGIGGVSATPQVAQLVMTSYLDASISVQARSNPTCPDVRMRFLLTF